MTSQKEKSTYFHYIMNNFYTHTHTLKCKSSCKCSRVSKWKWSRVRKREEVTRRNSRCMIELNRCRNENDRYVEWNNSESIVNMYRAIIHRLKKWTSESQDRQAQSDRQGELPGRIRAGCSDFWRANYWSDCALMRGRGEETIRTR